VGERQKTFTVYFEDGGFDERPFADAVAARIRSEPHPITFDDRELVDALPEVVDAQGEPFGSTSIAAQWFVMREARRADVKVMLDGQGGDETLAGYTSTTWPYRLADLATRGSLGAVRHELGATGLSSRAAAVALTTPFLPRNLRWRLRARRRAQNRLLGPALRRTTPPLATPSGGPFPDRLRRQYHVILAQLGLPELLRYEDRNSMAHSLEARVPFLDHRLVELLYGVDAALLAKNGTTKVILRRALADLLPAEVRERRDKLGFVTPEVRFLRGRLGDLVEETLSLRAARSRGFVDVDEALGRLRTVRNGGVAGFELWRAASVELWARAYLD
jgi:asparagine synthase (glutamine-hydrolysing)